MAKLTKADFIAQLAPQAVQARRDGSLIFPSLRLAQNLLETGGIIVPWYNLGGIKVGDGQPNEWWDGSSVNKKTWEVYNGKRVTISANFRAYKSVYHFYRDQDRLFNQARYARVRAAVSPNEQARALYLCGYATDPFYADKLISIMIAYGLYQYDNAEVEEPMTKAEKQAFDELAEQVQQLSSAVAALAVQIKAASEKIPAPKWFIAEFGEGVLEIINDPSGTLDFWRTTAVTLRATGYNKGSDAKP